MAIIRPENMDFKGKKFSMIISGSPGTGKTTMALSAPDPILIDFDKGISRVKAQHRKPTIMCNTYEEVLTDLQSPVIKEFETIIVDTGGSFITFLQDWAMRTNPIQNKQKNGAISLKGFGAVKAEFVRFTNMLQYTFNKNIIYIFHTVEQKDKDTTKQRLLCEGAARDIVWQPCDLGCFLQIIGEDRTAGFTPTEEYFAKGCFGVSGIHKLPALNVNTNNDFLTGLFTRMQHHIADESIVWEEEKAAYSRAMEAGLKIVADITNASSANVFAAALDTIEHALTSRKEIATMARTRIAEIGLIWNKEAKEYVSAVADTPPVTAAEPIEEEKTDEAEPIEEEKTDEPAASIRKTRTRKKAS